MGATCDSNTSSTVVDIFVQYEMLSRQTCYMVQLYKNISLIHQSITFVCVILDKKTNTGIWYMMECFELKKKKKLKKNQQIIRSKIPIFRVIIENH